MCKTIFILKINDFYIIIVLGYWVYSDKLDLNRLFVMRR